MDRGQLVFYCTVTFRILSLNASRRELHAAGIIEPTSRYMYTWISYSRTFMKYSDEWGKDNQSSFGMI